MPDYQVIGKPVPRLDAVEKVTGAARYAADVNLPGMLWATCLHSPHPHARIKRIDTSKAQAVPGVRRVVTRATLGSNATQENDDSLPGLRLLRSRFARDRIR